AIHAGVKAGDQPLSFEIAAHKSDDARVAAKRRDVVGGVCRAPGDECRRVVLQDQGGRLPRDAGGLAGDELVSDEMAGHYAAAAGLSTIASALSSGRRRTSAAPVPLRTRIPRAPTACASPTSIHLSPTPNDRRGSRSRSRAAQSTRPRAGLRHSQGRAYAATEPSGWCGQW